MLLYLCCSLYNFKLKYSSSEEHESVIRMLGFFRDQVHLEENFLPLIDEGIKIIARVGRASLPGWIVRMLYVGGSKAQWFAKTYLSSE